jgi:hypothetical protein
MAISNLLPAATANDNKPNLKQFFGKNPAVANDNVERVSSGMFSDTFVNSVVTTLQGLVDEIAKITNMANDVIASFNAVVKSIKSLNKDVTNRFRVLNNELNASKIDFVKTLLNVPKAEAAPVIQGVPVNVNAAPAAKEEGGFDLGDLLSKFLDIKMAGSLIRSTLGGLMSFFVSPPGLALLAFGGAFFMLYKGLDDLTKAIMADPMFAALKRRSEGKTDLEEVSDNAKQVGQKLKGRPELQQGFKGIQEAFYKDPGNSWGEGGTKLEVKDFLRFPKNKDGQEIGILRPEKRLKDGTVAINIQTGQKYGTIDENNSLQGDVAVSNPIGAPSAPAAPAAAPTGSPADTSSAAPTGAPQAASSPAPAPTGAPGGETPGAPAGAPSGETPGAPVGEVKPEATTQAPPTGRPSLKGAIASISAPPAGPSVGNSGAPGGVAVVKNSSVQNIGSTGGAETGNMSGQNLPMFARNPKLQGSFDKQVLKEHQ